ncbi:hypothetical protein MYK68_18585 [Gordonia sp. PP30]|uniref:hypothetical protein n=1 Tax=Gordonia sp. PP30 TaxID=2935861 RepID=UPI001FFF5DFB|nr:hypothetical protein [Gordonia sp. PP30]UQE74692.1 hypothetical protein MYK68_18585 [Gordonia sp. PP30]
MTDYDLDKVAAAAVAELTATGNRSAVHNVLTKVRETVGDQAYPAVLPRIFGGVLDQLPKDALALALPEFIGAAVAALPADDDPITAAARRIDPGRVRIDPARRRPSLNKKETLR